MTGDSGADGAGGPRIDFIAGAMGYRLSLGEGRGGALARAIGLGKGRGEDWHIADATAGLGRDAFLLASLGARVTLIERAPAIHAALAQALARASEAGGLHAQAAARMTLLAGDSRALLPGLAPDAILIDPMHPPRRKSALVKKEMRDLRAIVGDDPDAAALIAAALDAASDRVVVKWPARAGPVPAPRAPSHTIAGKTTRYDVFLIR